MAAFQGEETLLRISHVSLRLFPLASLPIPGQIVLPLPATEEVGAKREEKREQDVAGCPWMDPSRPPTLLSNGASTRP